MKYLSDWSMTKERYKALWQNEIVDRCCVSIPVLLTDQGEYQAVDTMSTSELYKHYTDADVITQRYVKQFDETYFAGDALASIFPYFGTGGYIQYLGAKPTYLPQTIWFDTILFEPDHTKIKFDENDEILKEHTKLMKDLVEKSNGDYFISMPDNLGFFDALAELRGTNNLLIDLIDEPNFVKEACKILVDVQKKTNQTFFDIIRENNDNGSVHGWMHTWDEGSHGQVQCDFSVMISPETFEEFILPNLIETSKCMNHAIYHLDGQEQIRHLDMILSIDSINMIQWTAVAGQPHASSFINVFKKIQKAGKGLVLILQPNEVEIVMKELSSKGLQLIVDSIKTKEDADRMIKNVEKWTHD